MLAQTPNAHFPGQIWLRQPDGSHRLIEDTPANRQVVAAIEMTASLSTAQPLRDRATLDDFHRQCPTHNHETFTLWARMHEIPPRESMTLAMEAGYATAPLQAAQHAREHEPRVPEEAADMPIARRLAKKVKRIFDSSSLDCMQVSGASSLEWLASEGIVVPGMTETELYSRLRKIMAPEDASRLAFQAHEAGWFAAGVAPERTSGEHPHLSTPNGSTFHEHDSDWPLRHHIPPSRVANLQALAEVRQVLDTLRPLVEALQARKDMRGRVE